MPEPEFSWEAVLEYLDTRVRDLERYAAHVGAGDSEVDDHAVTALDDWIEPRDIGSIPESLVDKAQDVLHRQNELMIRLSEAAEMVRSELSNIQGHNSRPTRHSDSTPLFIDLAG